MRLKRFSEVPPNSVALCFQRFAKGEWLSPVTNFEFAWFNQLQCAGHSISFRHFAKTLPTLKSFLINF